MYEYRNKKTGASFRSVCPCGGDDWELISEAADSAAKNGKNAKPKKKAAAPDGVLNDGGDTFAEASL